MYPDKLILESEHVEIVKDCMIRSGPFDENAAVFEAKAGEIYPFAGLVNKENDWLEVEYATDEYGWVSPEHGRLVK